MTMNFRIFVNVFVIALLLVSCKKDDPISKINKQNVEKAQQRDYSQKYEAPLIKFDRTEHDFGTIKEGDIVETEFTFKNDGKSELIISSATATCGCTVPEYPKEPILPGQEGRIKVKFDSNHRPNKQQKEVNLTTNTENGTEKLIIKAMVTPKAS